MNSMLHKLNLISAILCFTVLGINAQSTIINLYPGMVVNESGLGNAVTFVDEPTIAGDPRDGTSGSPSSQWEPGWDLTNYPASAYIDLGKTYDISDLYLFDSNSSADFIVELGEPGNWSLLDTYPCNKYNSWYSISVNQESRYVRLTMTHRDSHVSEVVIYGEEVEGTVEISPEEEIMEELSPLKISVSAGMVQFDETESGIGDPVSLFDEQSVAGDPLYEEGGNPLTNWETGWSSTTDYPVYATVDLHSEHIIKSIFIRDANGNGEFNIYAGEEGNWNLVATDYLNGYLSWNQHNMDTLTRYLKFEKTANYNLNEIVIYGYPANTFDLGDTIPPLSIIDLDIEQSAIFNYNLSWTATGDDADTGFVHAYDIRYSLDSITEANFASADSIDSYFEILESGELQTLDLDMLPAGEQVFVAIKAIDDSSNVSELSNVVSIQTVDTALNSCIVVDETMVINENCQGDASCLFDEQQNGFDPDNEPSSVWQPGYNTWMFPIHVTIDLKGECELNAINIYDVLVSEGDTVPFTIYSGEPFNWTAIITDSLKNGNVWNRHEVNLSTRYLRIEYTSHLTKVGEILIQGSRVGAVEAIPAAVAHSKALMHDFIGINAFPDDPIGRLQAVGFVREYHDWMWNDGNAVEGYQGYPNNELVFKTMGIDFDAYYQNLQNNNMGVVPAIQGNAPYLVSDNAEMQDKPIYQNGSSTDPQSYIAHADFMYQFAARYGSQSFAASDLKLASSEDTKSGLNTIKYYENWNEQDKWWNGRDAYFTPYEYMAMSSADYDGHQGTMGSTVGLINADANAQFVMAGIAKPNIDYVKAMKLWSDYNRGGDFMFDVINLHIYANNHDTSNIEHTGIAPEVFGLKEKMKAVVDYRNRYLPGTEVWVSEFGYDTNPSSSQRALSVGSFSIEQTQGIWMVRSFMELAAAGIDKAMAYMLRDVSATSSVKYASSGLVSSKATGFIAKPSWYHVNTMHEVLQDLEFSSEASQQGVNVYKFDKQGVDYQVYAVWSPTMDDIRITNFSLSLGTGETFVKVIELNDSLAHGNTLYSGAVSNSLSLNVSESPIFVITASNAGDIPEYEMEYQLVLSPDSVENISGFGDATTLVDEQDSIGYLLYDNHGGSPTTNWDLGYNATYPSSAVIALGGEYNVSKLYVYDSNGSGKVTFEVLENGAWVEVAEENLVLYNTWVSHIINKTTTHIRVTKYAGGANFNEIAVFVK